MIMRVRTGSERIVDAGEDGGAFATPSDVDEADYERFRDCAESNSADRVHFRERVVAQVVRDASRFGERRQLEYAVGAEDGLVPHSRAHLDVHDEQVVVNEAAGAVSAQRFLIGQQALVAAKPRLRPEWNLAVNRLVFVENVPGERDALTNGIVLAQFGAKAVVRDRAAESAIRNSVIEPPERARARDIHRVARVVLKQPVRQNFAAP